MKECTYVYGLFDKEDRCIYVGKSISPYGRGIHHQEDKEFEYLKVLDSYEDLEQLYIHRMLENGEPLQNREVHSNRQTDIRDVEVGQIIRYTKRGNNGKMSYLKQKRFRRLYHSYKGRWIPIEDMTLQRTWGWRSLKRKSEGKYVQGWRCRVLDGEKVLEEGLTRYEVRCKYEIEDDLKVRKDNYRILCETKIGPKVVECYPIYKSDGKRGDYNPTPISTEKEKKVFV